MSNLEKAKKLLQENAEYTLVLCNDDDIIIKTDSGVKPMLNLISDEIPLKGFCAADKIIGKAAAMLFAYANVSEVYGEVLSKAAIHVLEKYGIKYSYGTLTDRIINRQKTGLCPIEEAVLQIDDKEKALEAIKNKIILLRKNTK